MNPRDAFTLAENLALLATVRQILQDGELSVADRLEYRILADQLVAAIDAVD